MNEQHKKSLIYFWKKEIKGQQHQIEEFVSELERRRKNAK